MYLYAISAKKLKFFSRHYFFHLLLLLAGVAAQQIQLRPPKQVKLLRALDEPERVLAVHLPQQAVLHQLLVVLVDTLHVEVGHQLHQCPLRVQLHVVLLSQDPGHVTHRHLLVHQQGFGAAVAREHLGEKMELNVVFHWSRTFALVFGIDVEKKKGGWVLT